MAFDVLAPHRQGTGGTLTYSLLGRATRDDRAIPGAIYPLGQCQNNGGCPDPWGWDK